jgi:hypothetical protein
VRGEEGERGEAPEEEERDRDGEGWSSPMGSGGEARVTGRGVDGVTGFGEVGLAGNGRNPASLGRSVPSVPEQLRHYSEQPVQSVPIF